MSDIITHDEEGLPIPDGGESFSYREEAQGTPPAVDVNELEDGMSIHDLMDHPEFAPRPETPEEAQKRIDAERRAQFLAELEERRESGGAYGDLGGQALRGYGED